MKELSPDAQVLADDFTKAFGNGRCHCYLGNAPCVVCQHPGNPYNLRKDPGAWTTYAYEYKKEAPMQVEFETIIMAKLSLTELQVRWLRAQMQKPLNCDPEMEEPRDKEMREMFFKQLKLPVIT